MRIIPRLDVKNEKVIKGINLEGLRVVGNPLSLAKKYYDEGADELIYIDCVASLYGQNNLTEIILKSTRDIFIPFCVGGGIRSVLDAEKLFKNGADKIAINTAGIENIVLIDDLLATGGTLKCAEELISMSNGNVVASLVVIELTKLSGALLLKNPLHSLIKYDE